MVTAWKGFFTLHENIYVQIFGWKKLLQSSENTKQYFSKKWAFTLLNANALLQQSSPFLKKLFALWPFFFNDIFCTFSWWYTPICKHSTNAIATIAKSFLSLSNFCKWVFSKFNRSGEPSSAFNWLKKRFYSPPKFIVRKEFLWR